MCRVNTGEEGPFAGAWLIQLTRAQFDLNCGSVSLVVACLAMQTLPLENVKTLCISVELWKNILRESVSPCSFNLSIKLVARLAITVSSNDHSLCLDCDGQLRLL